MPDIWLPPYKPIVLADLEKLCDPAYLLGEEPPAPLGFFRRRDPFDGERGPVDLMNISVQAVLHTLVHGLNVHPVVGPPTSIWHFIPSARSVSHTASMAERLIIMYETYREVEHKFDRPYFLRCEGAVSNPNSSYIFNDEPSRALWYNSESKVEILFDTCAPETVFLRYGLDGSSDRAFSHVAQSGALRAGPIDFVHPLHYGYYMPVLGVTQFVSLDELSDTVSRANRWGVERRKLPESFYDSRLRNTLLRPVTEDECEHPGLVAERFSVWFDGLEPIV
jgi:hypothetical protein